MSGYYDREAPVYDESRGGVDRARAAADAVVRLVGTQYGVALDVGGGTGVVSAEPAARGWPVIVLDGSLGMLGLARHRLPGRVAATDAEGFSIADSSVDLVTAIWLLHLLTAEAADRVLAEAARVLRPGGHLVTTVDKLQAHDRRPLNDADDHAPVSAVAARSGLTPVGESRFSGRSQWGSAAEGDQVFPLLAFRRHHS
ncbi:MAG: class I SAM-dependent methyltransferase [Actinomycetota bacterium]|nr:class I SAM-dependent methyltransferase [Actinomycetota bacterium]